jgi:hypothetical protein
MLSCLIFYTDLFYFYDINIVLIDKWGILKKLDLLFKQEEMIR